MPGGGCMFSVFFYPSVDDQVFRVLAIEVTDEAVAAGATEDQASEAASPKVMDQTTRPSGAASQRCSKISNPPTPGNSIPRTFGIMSPQPLPLETPRTRIVIIDDDDLFRESLGLNLAEQGFVVVDFSGGQPALDYLLAGNRADAVLLDWRMPGWTARRCCVVCARAKSTCRSCF